MNYELMVLWGTRGKGAEKAKGANEQKGRG